MPSAGSTRATTRLTIRSDARELKHLREQLREFLVGHSVAAQLCDDLILVTNELATNAIEAAARGSDVTVELRVDSAQIRLTVENIGPPFSLSDAPVLPPPTDLRGRGLALTRQIVDELTTEPTVDGTRVIATCRRTGESEVLGEVTARTR